MIDSARERGEVTDQDDTETAAYLLLNGVGMWEHSHPSVPVDEDLRRILALVLASFTQVELLSG